MKLRSKFFILSAVLFAALAGTQWVLLNLLTKDLRSKTEEAAFEVSAATVAFLAESAESDFSSPQERKFLLAKGALPASEPTDAPSAGNEGDAILLSSTPGADGEINVRLIMEQIKEGTAPASFPAIALTPATTVSIEHRIPIPQEGFDDAFDDYALTLILSSVVLLLIALTTVWFITFRLTSPLQELATASRRLGKGELGVQISERGGHELATTARAFNTMSTELTLLEEERHRSHERKHLTEIGEIARALAHTMRNPLNTLGLSLERLEPAVPVGDGKREVFDLARGQINRLEEALRVFFALAAGSRGAIQNLRIPRLARDVALEVVQGSIEGVNVEVVATDEGLSLDAVEPELRAVFQALIVNAAEASPPGGVVEVHIDRCNKKDGRNVVSVVVDDRGAGLDPSVKERLFTPHVTSKSHGAGMGLFLARRIVEGRYQGKLDLAERDGGGVSARLQLSDREEEVDDRSRPLDR